MITDERLRHLSSPDYAKSEPGQLAAELLTSRARVQSLEAALREIAEYDCEWDSGNCGGCASCEARACFPVETEGQPDVHD